MDDIKQTILHEEAGRRVKLQDVASISRGFKEREIVSRVRGKEAVELALYKEGGANTVQVASIVKDRLKKLEESLPPGFMLSSTGLRSWNGSWPRRSDDRPHHLALPDCSMRSGKAMS